MLLRLLLSASLALSLAGCLALENPFNSPIVSQSRSITPVRNAGRSLTVAHGLGFSSSSGGTRRISFPAGVYPLEAEDAGYWYFRASAPITFTELSTENWMPRAQMGGLMVAKSGNPLAGGGYVDGSASTKILVWKLGAEFLALEGQYWKKNF